MNITLAIASDLHAFTGGTPPSWIKANDHNQAPEKHPIPAIYALISERKPKVDYLICPGDLCNRGDIPAAQYAWTQLELLSKELHAKRFLAVTGNHDLDSRYLDPGTQDPKEALQSMQPSYPLPDSSLHNVEYWANHFAIVRDPGVRTLLVNTCATHGMKKDETDHGRITKHALDKIAAALKADTTQYAVNIAICHHHPQQHAELELGEYDFMREGQQFLDLLGCGRFGRWIVIHGHKHHPKLTYAAGGNISPVVFSAGSFAAFLGPHQYSTTLNTFHIVEIEGDLSHSTLHGQVQTFEFGFSYGWRPAAETSALPHLSGFGFRGDLFVLAKSIATELANKRGTQSLTILSSFVPDLKWLLPTDRLHLFEVLRQQYSILNSYDQFRQETLFYHRGGTTP